MLIVGQALELNLGEDIEKVLGRRWLSSLGQELFLRLQVYSFQPIIKIRVDNQPNFYADLNSCEEFAAKQRINPRIADSSNIFQDITNKKISKEETI